MQLSEDETAFGVINCSTCPGRLVASSPVLLACTGCRWNGQPPRAYTEPQLLTLTPLLNTLLTGFDTSIYQTTISAVGHGALQPIHLPTKLTILVARRSSGQVVPCSCRSE